MILILMKKQGKILKIMKIRRIILIVGASLVYISYIVRFVLLCKFNKKLIIVDDNVTQVAVYVDTNNHVDTNNNVDNNNNIDNVNSPNQAQILTTNENRAIENK